MRVYPTYYLNHPTILFFWASVVIFFFPYNPTPPIPTNPTPGRPTREGLIFGPFRLRLALFGSVGLRLAPFRAHFGPVSGCWVGSGWGRGEGLL